MKGFYLYCFREKNPALIKAVKTTLNVVKTIDEGEAYTVPHQELEAVVSEVDLKEFSSEEIQRKAQEDINWIKEKAQIHEHVIERAMAVGGKIMPVIPMKFGTIFKTKKNLKEVLEKNYSKFRKLLENLEGKQEWGVKVYFEPAKNKLAYLNEDVFADISETPRTVTRRGSSEVKKLANVPKGMDFFVKKQMEEEIAKKKDRKLKSVLKKVFKNLQNLALKASQGKNLDQVLTGRKEPMVLNINLLIKEEKVGKFQKEVNELKAKYKNLGLIIQESGPWPPYNFVET